MSLLLLFWPPPIINASGSLNIKKQALLGVATVYGLSGGPGGIYAKIYRRDRRQKFSRGSRKPKNE